MMMMMMAEQFQMMCCVLQIFILGHGNLLEAPSYCLQGLSMLDHIQCPKRVNLHCSKLLLGYSPLPISTDFQLTLIKLV